MICLDRMAMTGSSILRVLGLKDDTADWEHVVGNMFDR